MFLKLFQAHNSKGLAWSMTGTTLKTAYLILVCVSMRQVPPSNLKGGSEENRMHIRPPVASIFLPVWCHRDRLFLYLTFPCAMAYTSFCSLPYPSSCQRKTIRMTHSESFKLLWMLYTWEDGTCKIDCLLTEMFSTQSLEATCIYSVCILSLSVCSGGLLWWGLSTHCAIQDLREWRIWSLISKGRCSEVK